MSIKRAILVTVGCMILGLGCVGIVLPILPIVPFFLITRYCFSASNERLHRWFIGTKLYKCAVNIVRNTKKKRDFPQRESLLLVNHSEAKPGSNQVERAIRPLAVGRKSWFPAPRRVPRPMLSMLNGIC